MDKALIVGPSTLHGSLKIPSSKSHTLRALLFGLMGRGKSCIINPLPSPDTASMIRAISTLGAIVSEFPDRIEVIGVDRKLTPKDAVIDVGNSGQVLRFIGAIASLAAQPIVFTGDHSIQTQRPAGPLLEALAQLGVEVRTLYKPNHAPFLIRGPLLPGMAIMDGEDSQPVSGMLIASAFGPGPIELFVTNPGEKPWIDLTLSWLDRFGITYEKDRWEHYRISGNQSIEAFTFAVPGDFSSAAFPLAAACITGSELILENLDMRDIQGDKMIVEVLKKMGAHIDVDEENRSLHIRKSHDLRGISIDVNSMIDALPILAVLACFAEGETRLTGGKIARKKECDRIACIARELKKMGASIDEEEDGLTVRRSELKGKEVQGHHDHRIAMALAIAALGARGETKICGTDCIAKSYPTFVSDFQNIGARFKR